MPLYEGLSSDVDSVLDVFPNLPLLKGHRSITVCAIVTVLPLVGEFLGQSYL